MNENTKEIDSLFVQILKLIRTILLFPFFMYGKLMERIMRVIFKITYLVIKSAEKVPVGGPIITKVILSVSELSLFKWLALKYKND